MSTSIQHGPCKTTNSQRRSSGAQWLSGRVLDSRLKGRGFEPHRRHCVVSLSKNINPSLVLVQPRKTHPFITERLLMGRKESNQTNKQKRRSSIFAGQCVNLVVFLYQNLMTFPMSMDYLNVNSITKMDTFHIPRNL